MYKKEQRLTKETTKDRPVATWGYAQDHKWFQQRLVITVDFQPREKERGNKATSEHPCKTLQNHEKITVTQPGK